jgi:3-oxoacyl-[acyl-carrier-protein] synthase-3
MEAIEMAFGQIKDVQIKGIACALPKHSVDSHSYDERFGSEIVDKFIAMTGVKTRYVAGDEQCASDLCAVAAEKLLDQLKWKRSSIDAVILVTQSPDYRIPATACVLQERLGLSEECPAFDINLGCSGYVYGVWLAGTLISSGNFNRVLLLVGDISNYYVSPEDRSVAMIFGDGGSATAMERKEGKNISYCLRTSGKGFKNIIIPAGCFRNRHQHNKEPYLNEDGVVRSDLNLYMKGTELFNFTISEVPKSIIEFMNHFKLQDRDIDYYYLHQANLFMLKHIAKKIGVVMGKIPISIEKFGNTSAESIPVTIVDHMGVQKPDKPLRAILSGFGVGLSWGNLFLDMDDAVILPMIYTDAFYTEGGISPK